MREHFSLARGTDIEKGAALYRRAWGGRLRAFGVLFRRWGLVVLVGDDGRGLHGTVKRHPAGRPR